MLPIEKLQNINTLGELARLLGYEPKALSYILYKMPARSKYTISAIPKKSGGVRIIKAPDAKLKLLQKRLANFLYLCEKQLIYNSPHKKAVSHGFKKQLSIVTNAYNHRNKRYVFNIDLKDFFPTIHFGRVRGYFIKNRNFQLDPAIATLIAQIACHDNELPQGSPCSPVISNFIGHILDIRMIHLARKAKCTYSRYADDLTFSTNQKIFPSLIAKKVIGTETEWTVSRNLRGEVKRTLFEINDKKTSMYYKTNRQVTTGLVVNKRVNIKKEYYRNARAMCHSLFTKDEFYITNLALDPNNPSKSIAKKEEGTLKQLEGILSHIYHVKRPFELAKKDGHRKTNNTKGITKLYRDFLLYKYFFNRIKPLVVCEGVTDVIYLKSALKNLNATYPELISVNSGVSTFNISFLHLSKQVKEILNVADGSGLYNLTERYKGHRKLFRGKGEQFPVIVMSDDDDGGEKFKNALKKKLTPGAIPAHLTAHIYTVFVPLNGKKKSTIEDLFDAPTLATTLNGKMFSTDNDSDKKKYYGKAYFAKKVILPNYKTIDFSKFQEILDEFSTIISSHKSAKQTVKNVKMKKP